MESELIDFETTCIETDWINNLIYDIPLIISLIHVISVHNDCRDIIYLINYNPCNRKSELKLANNLMKALSRNFILKS